MKATEVVLQGLRLRLWEHPGSNENLPSVLCIHGALDTGRSFDAVAAAVAGRAHVTANDLRGHGQSDRVGAGGSYHLLDFLKDLGLLVQQRRFDVVVGHSMGGNLALMLVGALPACTGKLVLLDSVGPPPEDAGEQPARLGELLLALQTEKRDFSPVGSVDEAVARLQKWNPGLSDVGARRMIEPVLVTREEVLPLAMDSFPPGALRDFPFDGRLRGPTPFRFSEEFWTSCCDRYVAAGGSTVVVRARDGFVPAGDSDDSIGAPFAGRAQRLKARVVVVDGGHHVHVEHVEAVAAAILSR